MTKKNYSKYKTREEFRTLSFNHVLPECIEIGNVQYLYPDLQASRSLVQTIFQGFTQSSEIW